MTLADDFLARGNASVPQRKADYFQKALDYVRCRLVVPPGTTVLEMRRLAERYVFERNASRVVKHLVETSDGITEDLVRQSAALPSTPCWIEMPVEFVGGEVGKIGYMVDHDEKQDRPVVACVIRTPTAFNVPMLMGVVSPESLPMRPPYSVRVEQWCLNSYDEDDIIRWVLDLVDALFVLSQPRVSELREVAHHPKKQKARVRSGALPLLEYKHVRMLVGATEASYAQVTAHRAEDGGAHKRLHRVRGHVRVYRENEHRDKPIVTVIPQHWRGDAKLGIVLHETKVEEKS